MLQFLVAHMYNDLTLSFFCLVACSFVFCFLLLLPCIFNHLKKKKKKEKKNIYIYIFIYIYIYIYIYKICQQHMVDIKVAFDFLLYFDKICMCVCSSFHQRRVF